MATKARCNLCERWWPEHFVQHMVTSEGSGFVCPRCGLVFRNRMHGMPDDTPFTGTTASEIYDEFMDYLKENHIPDPVQSWPEVWGTNDS